MGGGGGGEGDRGGGGGGGTRGRWDEKVEEHHRWVHLPEKGWNYLCYAYTQVYICTVTALKSTYRPAGLPLVKKHTKARFPDPHHTSSSPLNLTKSSGHHHTSKSDGDNDRWKSQGKGGHEIELTDAFLVESKSTFARLEKEAQVGGALVVS